MARMIIWRPTGALRYITTPAVGYDLVGEVPIPRPWKTGLQQEWYEQMSGRVEWRTVQVVTLAAEEFEEAIKL
jgi:hypothetical protein